MSDDTVTRADGFTSCRFGIESERIQEPSDHEAHNDSVYFNFTPTGRSGVVGGVIRIGLRPNEGYSEASLVLPRADGSVVFHYLRSPLAPGELPVGGPEWRSGPLSLAAVEPTRAWRLAYAGDDARVVTDPAGFGARPGAVWRESEPIRCEVQLDWRAAHPVHVLSSSGNLMPGENEIAYGRSHYEQFGTVHGAVRMGGEEWEIDGAPSFRDHSWGPRVWESAPDQDFVTAYLEDGRRIVVIANRVRGQAEAHGVIWRPGESEPVPVTRYEIHSAYAGGPTPGESVGWTFEGGGEVIEVRGTVLGFLPLRVGRSPVRIAQTILRLEGPLPGRAKTDLTRPIADG